jgi:uncharacterized protein
MPHGLGRGLGHSSQVTKAYALRRNCGARVRLPLFPLHSVLFPEATLALQIFEPRYREMIGRCLAHDEPFGVVMILEGEEIGGEAVPRKIGTEAAIIASERSKDGRYDIVAEGRRRFEIVALDKSRAYLRADVEFLEDPLGDDAELLADTVAHLVEGVVQALEAHGHVVVDESWSQLDPRSLSYRVATALPGADEVRQELLEMRDVASRLRREAELLMSIHRVGIEAGAA